MNAVVVNSMVYSLSLRCSFARACLGIPAGLRRTGLGERGVHEISTVVYVNAQWRVSITAQQLVRALHRVGGVGDRAPGLQGIACAR